MADPNIIGGLTDNEGSGPDPGPPQALIKVYIDGAYAPSDLNYQYGSVTQNVSRTFTVVITNEGDDGSSFFIPKNGIYVTSDDPVLPWTSPAASSGITLTKGASVSFTVSLNTSAVKDFVIAISFSPSGYDSYVVPIFYTVVAPQVTSPSIVLQYNGNSVSKNATINLGDVILNGQNEYTFTVSNIAASNLIIPVNGISVSNGSLSLNPSSSSSIMIGFNDTSTFKIKLNTSSLGGKTTLLVIASNDTNNNPFIINLSYSVKDSYKLSVKYNSQEIDDNEEINLGSYFKDIQIQKNIILSNEGIYYGIRIISVTVGDNINLENVPSLPFVLQPNSANSMQITSSFNSSSEGTNNSSLKIQWEVIN